MGRATFLSGMAALYLVAFLSYYLQYPGLFGADGLLPANSFLERTGGCGGSFVENRNVLCLAQKLDVPFDVWAEGVALTGVGLSLMGIMGVHSSVVFVLLYLLYLGLYKAGQSMLSFQWDIFLLETGFAAILYTPLLFGSKSPRPPVNWLMRLQLFKIMFMSGVVKTQANCPTWKQLTALEYHFASQCIPTSQAWWAAQLPPLLLRMGVAASFLTQIPAPLLLLAPAAWCRRLGVLMQLPLQLLIMLTGNYNWFNLQVILLCLPAWEADSYFSAPVQPQSPTTAIAAAAKDRVRRSLWFLWEIVWLLAGLWLMLWSCQQMFSLQWPSFSSSASLLNVLWEPQVTIINHFNHKVCDDLVEWLLPKLFVYLELCVGISCLCYVLCTLGRNLASVLRTCNAIVVVMGTMMLCGICYVPFSSISNHTTEHLPSALLKLHRLAQPWSVTASYGLFRRMTGVGQVPPLQDASQWGWGGLPPAVVAVPGIVLEGSYDGKDWLPIPFRYVPFDAVTPPRRTAPMQPRLDWRMWFAALGSYQHDPWLVHLMYKVLLGSPPVLELLDMDRYPFVDAPPKVMRSSLHHWDFTRLDLRWAQRVPGVQMVNSTSNIWWSHKAVRDYAPPIELNNPSVKDFLRAQGWPTQLVLPQQQPCGTIDHIGLKHMCELVVFARSLPVRKLFGWQVLGLWFDFHLTLFMILFCTCLVLPQLGARMCGAIASKRHLVKQKQA